MNDNGVQERFHKFYDVSCIDGAGHGVPPPNKIIFGHTHEVMGTLNIPSLNVKPFLNPSTTIKSTTIDLYNSGGWVKNNSNNNAAIIFVDSNGTINVQQIDI
ncbi:MAG: hypothetical protein HQK93_05490 [Nitrospirae bacterium]|nr:hypothetical protein [Nitrospirota bacterium]